MGRGVPGAEARIRLLLRIVVLAARVRHALIARRADETIIADKTKLDENPSRDGRVSVPLVVLARAGAVANDDMLIVDHRIIGRIPAFGVALAAHVLRSSAEDALVALGIRGDPVLVVRRVHPRRLEAAARSLIDIAEVNVQDDAAATLGTNGEEALLRSVGIVGNIINIHKVRGAVSLIKMEFTIDQGIERRRRCPYGFDEAIVPRLTLVQREGDAIGASIGLCIIQLSSRAIRLRVMRKRKIPALKMTAPRLPMSYWKVPVLLSTDSQVHPVHDGKVNY